MLNFVQDLSFFIALVLCVIVKIRHIQKEKSTNATQNLYMETHANLFLIPILLLAFVSISYKIGETPKGLHVDEAGAFYDAICLSQYGVDRFLYRFPVYFINFGGGQNALYTYLATIFIKLFGANITVFRLPSLLLSLICLVCFYLMIAKDSSKHEALFPTFLLAISPWFLLKSRWGLESYLMCSMLTISCFVFMKALSSQKQLLYFLTGILFGLSLYTYAISYLVIPTLLGIVLLYLLFIQKISIKCILWMAIPLSLLAFPLILMLLYNKGILQTVNLPIVSIPKLWFFRSGEISLKHIPENLKNLFEILFIKDFLNYNSIETFGTLYKMSIPFVVFGFWEVGKNFLKHGKEKSFSLDFLMFVSFVVVLVVGLCIAELNINKINAIYIPMVYLAGKFLNSIFKENKILTFVLIGFYFFNFIQFENYYFTEFANTDLVLFEDTIMQVYQRAEERNPEKIYVENQNYIYALIATPISPYEFQKNMEIGSENIAKYGKYEFQIPEILNYEAVYILQNNTSLQEQLLSYGFEMEDFEKFQLFYFQK